MKKLIIFSVVVLMVGCSNNQTVVKEEKIEEPKKVIVPKITLPEGLEKTEVGFCQKEGFNILASSYEMKDIHTVLKVEVKGKTKTVFIKLNDDSSETEFNMRCTFETTKGGFIFKGMTKSDF